MAQSQSIYPADLASEVRIRWVTGGHPGEMLLESSRLVHVLDTAYQASLLSEEGDPVKCRLVVGSPADFLCCTGVGSKGLSILPFEESCEFTPHEIRKLAAAAGYYRSMLGVEFQSLGRARIWGIIVTGTRWVNRIEGGRFHGFPLPPNLVVQVVGPGHLVVATGYTRVLETASGQLLTEGFDPFLSKWLPQKFGQIRETILSELVIPETPTLHPQICDSFIKNVAQSVIRRVLSLVRTRGHGGMLVYLPEAVDDVLPGIEWFRFRATFGLDPSTLRFRQLINLLLQRVLVIGHQLGLKTVTWEDYQKMHDTELTELDESLIEFANLLADLMSVDGALVLDRGFRTIGFGGEILGDSHVDHIYRALDLEAYQTVREPAGSSGTRHRSAYRLVSGQPEAIAVVVSQDGAIRFVAHQNGRLTYWPYLP